MSVELETSFEPLSGTYLKTCCRPAYRVKWLKNKGAILIVFWNYLVMSIYHLLSEGYKEKHLDNPFHVSTTSIILWCMVLLFPIGGWLADTRVGRYKMIHYSLWIMWIGIMLATFGELLLTSVSITHGTQIKTGVYLCLCIIMLIGLGGFLSNIIQFGIDQLIDASATEITSFITWYTMTVYASGITVHYIADCIDTFYIKQLVVAFCLTLALCLDFLFQHKLVKEQVAGKSLRVILMVIKYTIGYRKLGNNYSIATESATSSRFNVAKHMYGGPFTSQQVDNVRKFLWMLMVIATCTIVFGAMAPMDYAKAKLEHHLQVWQESYSYGIKGCYKSMTIRYNSSFFVMALVFLYEFVIHPLLYRCLPKMRITSKFLFSTSCFFLWIKSLLAIEIVAYHQQTMTSNYTSFSRCVFTKKPDINISYKWLFISHFTSGLSQFLLTSSAFEFIWAQAPSSMKGLILGFGYSFVGLCTLLHTALASPFIFKKIAQHVSWEHAPLTCEIWYFLMEGVIVLVVLIVLSVLVKRYNKQKQRDAYFDPLAS